MALKPNARMLSKLNETLSLLKLSLRPVVIQKHAKERPKPFPEASIKFFMAFIYVGSSLALIRVGLRANAPQGMRSVQTERRAYEQDTGLSSRRRRRALAPTLTEGLKSELLDLNYKALGDTPSRNCAAAVG
ncbi:hypothetical protein EVAR_18992_1 [Eumeta japonica]|uniref:Uncharacterized protein n=1 Tax=Eumeta variegata TaxID=151549 RepID=A0A4C1V705_EUMVA|nr:hypothetical protein EVAR_18992_1 [Eumeta japonica]